MASASCWLPIPVASWQLEARREPHAFVQCPMMPFFIYYSMFGFQRVGDIIWQAGVVWPGPQLVPMSGENPRVL